MNRLDSAKKLTLISLSINGSLSLFKILAGMIGHSSVVLADGIDSLSDMLTTLLAFAGVSLSEKEADANHPYGHEKFEAILGKVLAFFLFLVSGVVFSRALEELRNPNQLLPTLLPLIAAACSILGKLFLSWYTGREAKKMKSSVYEADARNYLNDVVSSVLSLVGVFLAQRGFPIFQPIFTIVIAFFILRIAFDLYRDSLVDLTDQAADEEVMASVKKLILSHSSVHGIDSLKSRMHGKRIYIDLELLLDANLSLIEAHRIAEEVHDEIECGFPDVKHMMVHVNPDLSERVSR